MAKRSLQTTQEEVRKEIKNAQNLKELDRIYQKYLGRKGEVSLILRSLKGLSLKERKKKGQEANSLKRFLEKEVRERQTRLADQVMQETEWFDVTLPGEKPVVGHLHPLTQVKREIITIFAGMGFEVAAGPEVETEWYNFDALNIPKEHPARDAWDTFWLQNKQKSQTPNLKSQKLLLRTHTSPVQVRYMEAHPPPLRMIVPGKVFRHEATDASHEMQFYQVEGLMVDQDVSVAHFKAVIKEFFNSFFKTEFKFRLRPDYFPFTEPSFDVSLTCLVCGGRKCNVCKQTGWLEIAGAGMIHPNVFKCSGLNPKDWQGWAFGFGWDRLAMLKYKIDDIRLFNSGDLRFLRQF